MLALGSTTVAALAGCLGDDDTDETNSDDNGSGDDNGSSDDLSNDDSTDDSGGDGESEEDPYVDFAGRGDEEVTIQVRDCQTPGEEATVGSVGGSKDAIDFGGRVRVPDGEYDITADASYDAGSDTLVITTDYELPADMDGDSCRGDEGRVMFRQGCTLHGATPGTIRLDIRDVDGLQEGIDSFEP